MRPRFQKKPEPVKKNYNPDRSVWQIIRPIMIKTNQDDAEDFMNCNWEPDPKRIKRVSLETKDMTIPEAFNWAYPGCCNVDSESTDIIPCDVQVGDFVYLYMTGFDGKDAVFEAPGYKLRFLAAENLYKYQKLRDFTPNNKIGCHVTNIRDGIARVSVLKPMAEQFIIQRSSNPQSQNKIECDESITVKNLRCVRGGLVGDAVIPNVYDFVGEQYTMPAFIPGSQVGLNITKDFESYTGKSLDVFISFYNPSNNGKIALGCSAKKYQQHMGHLILMKLFKLWCEQGDDWNLRSQATYDGIVTGVINSSRKCGVFVEVPDLHCTGMIPLPASELTKFHSGDKFPVRLKDFEENIIYDPVTKKSEHGAPYVIENGILTEFNIKPIFKMSL